MWNFCYVSNVSVVVTETSSVLKCAPLNIFNNVKCLQEHDEIK